MKWLVQVTFDDFDPRIEAGYLVIKTPSNDPAFALKQAADYCMLKDHYIKSLTLISGFSDEQSTDSIKKCAPTDNFL